MSAPAIPFGRPWITDADRAAVARVLDGHMLAHGPEVAAFEAEFAAFMGGDATCVATSSCMGALHVAYLELGVGPGDEVVVPAQTHVATAHAVALTGARPVFADCDPSTGNVTADALRAAVGPRTAALSVVHFAGIPCDMTAVAGVARAAGLAIVEDCALAVGARWDGAHVGLLGDHGCFSFYPVKHLTTGEGGMLVCRDGARAARARRMRGFGVDRGPADRARPGMYDVTHLGSNYRMAETAAALGRSQLARAADMLAHRAARFAHMADALRDVPGLRVLDVDDPRGASGHYCLTLALDGAPAGARDRLQDLLGARGVGTTVHYPHPVPRLRYYREAAGGFDPAGFPGAVAVSDTTIALPVGPHVTEAGADRIVEALAGATAEAA